MYFHDEEIVYLGNEKEFRIYWYPDINRTI